MHATLVIRLIRTYVHNMLTRLSFGIDCGWLEISGGCRKLKRENPQQTFVPRISLLVRSASSSSQRARPRIKKLFKAKGKKVRASSHRATKRASQHRPAQTSTIYTYMSVQGYNNIYTTARNTGVDRWQRTDWNKAQKKKTRSGSPGKQRQASA